MEAKLTRLVEATCRHRWLEGVVLCVSMSDRSLCWCGGTGNLGPDTQYFIASTTKLYTSAIVFMLEEQGQLNLEDLVSSHVSPLLLQGLQTYGGRDRADSLTVRHLISHTSGIPDYFQGQPASGPSLESRLVRGQDEAWELELALERARTITPTFGPGTPGKALYSDTNFQLLGRVVECASGRSYQALLRQLIFDPLGLTQTYLYDDPADDRPVALRYKKQPLAIPRAMASFGPDGGIVSTARETMRFLRAFFEGELFSADRIPTLCRWTKIFFPLEYGLGISRFRPRWFMVPFGLRSEFIGHSGLSGAFAFYCRDRELYLAGTVNEVSRPDLSFRLMLEATKLF